MIYCCKLHVSSEGLHLPEHLPSIHWQLDYMSYSLVNNANKVANFEGHAESMHFNRLVLKDIYVKCLHQCLSFLSWILIWCTEYFKDLIFLENSISSFDTSKILFIWDFILCFSSLNPSLFKFHIQNINSKNNHYFDFPPSCSNFYNSTQFLLSFIFYCIVLLIVPLLIFMRIKCRLQSQI